MRTHLAYYYHKIFKRNNTFLIYGERYAYFYHWYNFTWRNERAVELGFFLDVLKKNRNKKILEIGNVSVHYTDITHDVVDKYEKAENVINEDVVSFRNKKKYNLIICISTMEHVGFDETPKDSQKLFKALLNIQRLLSKKGKLIMSSPIGYNPDLDAFIDKNHTSFSQFFVLRRVSSKNSWKESTWEKSKGAQYNTPYSNANAITISILEKRDIATLSKDFPSKIQHKRKRKK